MDFVPAVNHGQLKKLPNWPCCLKSLSLLFRLLTATRLIALKLRSDHLRFLLETFKIFSWPMAKIPEPWYSRLRCLFWWACLQTLPLWPSYMALITHSGLNTERNLVLSNSISNLYFWEIFSLPTLTHAGPHTRVQAESFTPQILSRYIKCSILLPDKCAFLTICDTWFEFRTFDLWRENKERCLPVPIPCPIPSLLFPPRLCPACEHPSPHMQALLGHLSRIWGQLLAWLVLRRTDPRTKYSQVLEAGLRYLGKEFQGLSYLNWA